MSEVDIASINIKQYLNRLDDSSSGERIQALEELQNFTRTSPILVGELSIQRVFEFLYDRGSSEEYLESLDLLHRLISSRDTAAAIYNVDLILSNKTNVELLLDLLEHHDITVAVMVSQVLTQLHHHRSIRLESLIQDYPDGWLKYQLYFHHLFSIFIIKFFRYE
jgi:hypothetical protein